MFFIQAIREEALYVSIGDHNVAKKDEFERVIRAKKINIHKQFHANDFENDIGRFEILKI